MPYEKEPIKEEIIKRLSEGEPLRPICRENGKPSFKTIYRWLDEDPDFSAKFWRARELGYDAIAEDCLEIADDARNDWMVKKGEDGKDIYQYNKENVQRSKLRVWTRLQLLAKWSNKYSDKYKIIGDPTAPLQTNYSMSEALESKLNKMCNDNNIQDKTQKPEKAD